MPEPRCFGHVGPDDTRETLIARGMKPEAADEVLKFRDRLAAKVPPAPVETPPTTWCTCPVCQPTVNSVAPVETPEGREQSALLRLRGDRPAYFDEPPHPEYGPCDAFGGDEPNSWCSECSRISHALPVVEREREQAKRRAENLYAQIIDPLTVEWKRLHQVPVEAALPKHREMARFFVDRSSRLAAAEARAREYREALEKVGEVADDEAVTRPSYNACARISQFVSRALRSGGATTKGPNGE